jgi:hypothetical protein
MKKMNTDKNYITRLDRMTDELLPKRVLQYKSKRRVMQWYNTDNSKARRWKVSWASFAHLPFSQPALPKTTFNLTTNIFIQDFPCDYIKRLFVNADIHKCLQRNSNRLFQCLNNHKTLRPSVPIVIVDLGYAAVMWNLLNEWLTDCEARLVRVRSGVVTSWRSLRSALSVGGHRSR